MEIKKILSALMILLGGAAMVYGIIALFSGNLESVTWIAAILGTIFFTSGMGLLKSAQPAEG